ncbi:hypothetical protein [Streptomyces sp. CA-179760]|uniref:hypothetical protein n=1 Tax=Streptomyces sp. CA-179760 TaxID=3240054 RepID=UPI003D921D00
MHRTTTTATLLVTVAVSALSGCVKVQDPPVPGPPATPSRPSAPRPEEQVVQAPAREALELIEGSRRPTPAASTSRPATRPAATPEQGQPPSGTRDARPHPARPERQAPAPRGRPQRPPGGLPDISESVRQDVHKNVPKNADVCALGTRYGGWRPDSPEATICRDTYRR